MAKFSLSLARELPQAPAQANRSEETAGLHGTLHTSLTEPFGSPGNSGMKAGSAPRQGHPLCSGKGRAAAAFLCWTVDTVRTIRSTNTAWMYLHYLLYQYKRHTSNVRHRINCKAYTAPKSWKMCYIISSLYAH